MLRRLGAMDTIRAMHKSASQTFRRSFESSASRSLAVVAPTAALRLVVPLALPPPVLLLLPPLPALGAAPAAALLLTIAAAPHLSCHHRASGRLACLFVGGLKRGRSSGGAERV